VRDFPRDYSGFVLAGRVGVTLLCPGGMSRNFFEGREERFKPAPDAFEKNQLNDPREVRRR
jgi:hypothetical protein